MLYSPRTKTTVSKPQTSYLSSMIQRPCTHPGCGAFALPRSSRCEKHRQKQTDSSRVAVRIRNSHAWQKVRRIHAKKHPTCCDPFGEHLLGPEPVESIHHVLGLDSNPELAFYESNLRSLCNACHSRVEKMERSGESTQHLFEEAL